MIQFIANELLLSALIYILQPNIKILQQKLQLYNNKTSKISRLGVVKREETIRKVLLLRSPNHIIGKLLS